MKGRICQSAIADRRRARAAGLDCKDFCMRRRPRVLRGMGELRTSQPVHRTHVHDDPLHLGRHKKTACAWSIGALLEATSRIGPCDVGAPRDLSGLPPAQRRRAGVAGMVWFEDEVLETHRWSASIAPRAGSAGTAPDGSRWVCRRRPRGSLSSKSMSLAAGPSIVVPDALSLSRARKVDFNAPATSVSRRARGPARNRTSTSLSWHARAPQPSSTSPSDDPPAPSTSAAPRRARRVRAVVVASCRSSTLEYT